jgi:hypothetical protein
MRSLEEILYGEEFKICRDWIRRARSKKHTWADLNFGLAGDEKGLAKFLEDQSDFFFCTITCDEWHQLIKSMKNLEELNAQPGFIGKPHRVLLTPPENEGTCWQLYRKKLIEKRFSLESVQSIEDATVRVVSQLQSQTQQNDPVRGMVMGSVQSGKTANMAAVMSMAADYGFNFFIVLTGTIDSLRVQTRKRLIGDLNSGTGNLSFENLDNLSASSPSGYRLQDLYLGPNDKKRYITVCLKNTTRLKDLLLWLNKDTKAKSLLKVLLIDDEADQAGVNTANISKELLTRINAYIKDIVFGKTAKDEEGQPYRCMNYIGYTATPYANFLNEATEDSIYPKNFIMTLAEPSDYIGPKQIFGLSGENVGLPIVNTIAQDEIEDIQNGESFGSRTIPKEMEDAILWFICTVSIFRLWGMSKPVSMLIHTSQKIEKHEATAQAIEVFFKDFCAQKDSVSKIETVYEKQGQKLSLTRFKEELQGYSEPEKIKSLPAFSEIEPEIRSLLSEGIQHIKMNEEDSTLHYTNGLHLCVDNCANNGIDEENVVMRLVYPDSENKQVLKTCPAFIVVGGSTLSRGLTLEGLTCSYFLRTTAQADTLMQMGRWFGFRKGYELLPRLWLSQGAIDNFKWLTKLDDDLRDEIHNMETLSLAPTDYGPRLDSFPDFKLLKITSKNKMQGAYTIECDFANKTGQTVKFFNDDSIIQNNYQKAFDFVESLGPVDKAKIKSLSNGLTNDSTLIWFGQDYEKVLNFLGSLEFPKQLASIDDAPNIIKWFKVEYEKGILKNFDVVLSTLLTEKNTHHVDFSNFTLFLPTRRKLNDDEQKDFINLKAITAPFDRLLDIDASKMSEFEKEELRTGKDMTYKEKRIKFGKIDTPLLVLYIVDKDSGQDDHIDLTGEKPERLPLGIHQHLVGYYVYIPYGDPSKATPGANKVTVKLNFDKKGDIDDD